MEITLATNHCITPEMLAVSLANATPEDFAQFWLSFSKVCTSGADMHTFAKKMASEHGSNRKHALKKLAELITFYEISAEI